MSACSLPVGRSAMDPNVLDLSVLSHSSCNCTCPEGYFAVFMKIN